MDITSILGYLGALIIGVVLGLIGGGGSILTLPVLVYLLHINPVTATAYSLFVVGVSSTVGVFKNLKKGLVDFKTAFIFAVPSFIAVFLTRKFILPAIPETIWTVNSFVLTKDVAIMIFFAVIMLFASFSMIKGKCEHCDKLDDDSISYNYPMIVVEGIFVGTVTGVVGAGGGFLIIPALVLLAKLPMKRAVATSLFIIAIKSLIGFLGDISHMQIDWEFLLLFSGFSVIGMFIGVYLNKFIKGEKLKKGFGLLTLLMGIYILLKEFF
ncbi:sulfite exporter TauE/SafE family protein [Urechidicola sp. KH5]